MNTLPELLQNIDMMPINEEKMSDNAKGEVQKIKSGISFDYESVSLYGKEATKKLTDFSSQILDNIRMKDAPDVENMLMSLVGELDKFNTEELSEKKTSLFSWVTKADKMKRFMDKYKTVSAVISATKGKLEDAEFQLKKDIKTTEMYLDINREYIGELEKYILAAELRIEEEKASLEKERTNVSISDMLAVQELSLRESNLKTLERKVYNLRLQRMIAIQNIPQLMLIKDGDVILVQKIDDSINQAIPLWESQIVIGVEAARQQAGAKISRAVTNLTNNLLRKNAEILKQSAISVAAENERDIAEIETIRNTNNLLIETMNGVREERRKGEQKRSQSVKELAQLSAVLNQVMIEAYT